MRKASVSRSKRGSVAVGATEAVGAVEATKAAEDDASVTSGRGSVEGSEGAKVAGRSTDRSTSESEGAHAWECTSSSPYVSSNRVARGQSSGEEAQRAAAFYSLVYFSRL